MAPWSLLFFCCVAAGVQHQDIHTLGCSDSDGEDAYTLNGEVMWYADFSHQRGVEPQPSFIDHMTYREGTYEQAVQDQHTCRTNLGINQKVMKDLPLELEGPGHPIIYPQVQVKVGEKNTLVCHVSGFYPAPVTVSWTRNTKNVSEQTHINTPFLDSDGFFSQTARMDFVPQLGDVYGCSVQHPALDAPLSNFWEVQVQGPGIGPSVFCGVGLTVGLLGVASGTYFLVKGMECS